MRRLPVHKQVNTRTEFPLTRWSSSPVILGIGGACFLFYGSMLLIFEARLALSTIHHEMDFIWQRSKKVAPAQIVEQHKPHFVHFRRHE